MDTSLSVAFGPQITAAATRHNLQPRLLAAVAAQETGGPGSDSGRNIVGDQGHGHGVFQIDDRWHAFARTPAAMDPAKNADYAAGMIASNLERYGGDVHKALSAYNAGSPTATGTKTDWGDGQPIGYADSVLRHYARLAGGPADPTAPPAPADARDSAASVDALRGAAGILSSGTQLAPGSQFTTSSLLSATGQNASGTSGTSNASADAYPPMMMPLNLPAYKPLAQVDSRDRDVAPSLVGGDDSSDSD
jgi:hypothetical protein